MVRIAEKLKIGSIAAALAAAAFLASGTTARATGSVAAVTARAAHTLSADHGYYAMLNGRVEKWDFNSDGTFLHEGIAGGAGAYSRGSERGTYSIDGDKLVLKIGNTATAFAGGPHSNAMLGSSASTAPQTRDMRIQLLGPDGDNGVVLDGVTFHIRHGW